MVPDEIFRSPDPLPESPVARLVDSKEKFVVIYFSLQMILPISLQVI